MHIFSFAKNNTHLNASQNKVFESISSTILGEGLNEAKVLLLNGTPGNLTLTDFLLF